ncbi:creatininase family protein [Paenibacillus hamazuiensis]|uniref:creatininase family protein n=1 Tax=Paenibacillus hamazuiensis TaxID=2936508 RepID=UPI00200DC3FB|nr:creatininase family protein [Paenibacillus hamazuiensis]
MSKLHWPELLPSEFKARQAECPVVYLPIGLCEPHGPISALGLDSLKAVHICTETAKIAGGIIAPAVGYHIHEAGPSARWLEDNVGEQNPFMTSISPKTFFLLYVDQLRAFYNAGFKAVIALSGHGGAHQEDLKVVSDAFMKEFDINVWYGTDFELTAERFSGDHAGQYEISALLSIRPDLIDLSVMPAGEDAVSRFALHESAGKAESDYGKQIMHTAIENLADKVRLMAIRSNENRDRKPLSFADIESFWNRTMKSVEKWSCFQPREGQLPVSMSSRWKANEYLTDVQP